MNIPRLKAPRGNARKRIPGMGPMVTVLAVLAGAFGIFANIGLSTPAGAVSYAQINGTGSSFAAPAVTDWTHQVSSAPYSLPINYTSSSSGQGRYEFTNGTTDYAVSDTGYVAGEVGTEPPNFPFIFIPITAAGIAFMYNIPGLSGESTLQLTSYTACAVFTGAVTNWDSSIFHENGANAGVNLPNLHIQPVTENDTTGVNYVMEEWCIDEQPALWSAFANSQEQKSGGPTDGVPISATAPNSNWPGIFGGIDDNSTTAIASDVQGNSGAIGAVQVSYANDDGFYGSSATSAHNVASVLNSSGDYTQPTPVDVDSALAYATQLANGTHQLNFNGTGPHVYNPSTYSYLLTPTTGWQAPKGATLSAFVEYVLTIGQHNTPPGYGAVGLSLERYGVDAVLADVPGAVPVTSAENANYACGDLTPSEVQAGQTTPTCGVLNSNDSAPTPGADAGNAGTAPASGGAGSGGSGANGAGGSGSGANGAGGSGSGANGAGGSGSGANGAGGSGVDPGVALSGTNPNMAYTGNNPAPLAVAGGLLVACGWFVRRRLLRRDRLSAKAR
jgi:ABC-type phosphate transport system substrate-binding protein